MLGFAAASAEVRALLSVIRVFTALVYAVAVDVFIF